MNLHVHLDYLADPFCCRHGDWYYAVATGKAECYSPPFEGPHVVPMVKSRDLRQWERVGRGLICRGEALQGFAIAGEDGRFVWATATIENEQVVVSCPGVSHPKAVRYAWADNPAANLYNRDGLPASPFRADVM